MPYRRRPRHASHGPLPGKHHVFDLLADRLDVTQVMVLGKQSIEELFFWSTSHKLKFQHPQLLKAAGDWRLIQRDLLWSTADQPTSISPSRWRQHNPFLAVQS